MKKDATSIPREATNATPTLTSVSLRESGEKLVWKKQSAIRGRTKNVGEVGRPLHTIRKGDAKCQSKTTRIARSACAILNTYPVNMHGRQTKNPHQMARKGCRPERKTSNDVSLLPRKERAKTRPDKRKFAPKGD